MTYFRRINISFCIRLYIHIRQYGMQKIQKIKLSREFFTQKAHLPFIYKRLYSTWQNFCFALRTCRDLFQKYYCKILLHSMGEINLICTRTRRSSLSAYSCSMTGSKYIGLFCKRNCMESKEKAFFSSPLLCQFNIEKESWDTLFIQQMSRLHQEFRACCKSFFNEPVLLMSNQSCSFWFILY